MCHFFMSDQTLTYCVVSVATSLAVQRRSMACRINQSIEKEFTEPTVCQADCCTRQTAACPHALLQRAGRFSAPVNVQASLGLLHVMRLKLELALLTYYLQSAMESGHPGNAACGSNAEEPHCSQTYAESPCVNRAQVALHLTLNANWFLMIRNPFAFEVDDVVCWWDSSEEVESTGLCNTIFGHRWTVLK